MLTKNTASFAIREFTYTSLPDEMAQYLLNIRLGIDTGRALKTVELHVLASPSMNVGRWGK